MQIDHDPAEPKIDRGPGIWWLVFIMMSFGWAGAWYFDMIDWTSVAMGYSAGALSMAWALEITGNRVSNIWRKD